MKRTNSLNLSIRLLLVAVLAIHVFIKGNLQIWLLAAVFIAWGIFLLNALLRGRKKPIVSKRKAKSPIKPLVVAEVSETPEQVLQRHVDCRITERLKPYFPESNWEWVEKPASLASDGGTGRIRIYDVKGYNFVDVVFHRMGRIDFNMVRIVPLEDQRSALDRNDENCNEQPVPAVDVGVWYDIIGKTVLNNLITELNSHGHNSLYIKENGDVVVQRENTEVKQDVLDNLPSKSHWPELVNLFMKNGLTASSGNDCIALSW